MAQYLLKEWIVEAKQLTDKCPLGGDWFITRPDGHKFLLSDKDFRENYEPVQLEEDGVRDARERLALMEEAFADYVIDAEASKGRCLNWDEAEAEVRLHYTKVCAEKEAEEKDG